MANLYIAKETFVAHIDGVPTVVNAGQTLVDENHELYKRFSPMFKPAEGHYRSEVEQATQAPGEKRTVKA